MKILPRHNPFAFFLAMVVCIILFAVKSSHQGSLSYMIIPRKSIYQQAADYGLTDSIRYKPIDDHRAILNGKIVTYDAASYQLDTINYRYFHCIGIGTIEGGTDSVYLYRLNIANGFITVDSLISLHNSLIQSGTIKQ